jgi:hypothetical protein
MGAADGDAVGAAVGEGVGVAVGSSKMHAPHCPGHRCVILTEPP